VEPTALGRPGRRWIPAAIAEGSSSLIRDPLTLMMANKVGDTPLHGAVWNRRGAVALLLLDANPDRGHDLNGLGEVAAGNGCP
jgi:hypothetical protein